MSVATPVRKPRQAGPGSDAFKPWNVIVLNDNHNTFDAVARALAGTIPGISYERGLRIADTIHASGRAVVWSSMLEPAEGYHSRLGVLGLTMAPLEKA